MLEEEKETQERENVVSECTAMTEEESWSGWNQVTKQPRKINQGDWKKPKREVCQDPANNEAVSGRTDENMVRLRVRRNIPHMIGKKASPAQSICWET